MSHRIREWFFVIGCLCEGPVWTAVLIALVLGYPHGHPLLRGLLVLPVLAFFVLGWAMTYMVIVDPWGRRP